MSDKKYKVRILGRTFLCTTFYTCSPPIYTTFFQDVVTKHEKALKSFHHLNLISKTNKHGTHCNLLIPLFTFPPCSSFQVLASNKNKTQTPPTNRGGARNFCLGGPSCNTNIFIKTTPYTHKYTCFFYYIHTFFYLISCIYTHIQQKKSLIFSIKIMFDSYLS